MAKKLKEYRFAVPATLCFSIVAASEEDAIKKCNHLREEMESIHGIEGMMIDEEFVEGETVTAMNVAVYLTEDAENITSEHIEDISDFCGPAAAGKGE